MIAEVTGVLKATPEIRQGKKGLFCTLRIQETITHERRKLVLTWQGIAQGSLAVMICNTCEAGHQVRVRGRCEVLPVEREGQSFIGRTIWVDTIGVSGNPQAKATASQAQSQAEQGPEPSRSAPPTTGPDGGDET